MKLPQVVATVFDVCEKYLTGTNTIIVGVSGGPDSTALLHALHQFSESNFVKKNPLTIVVAHVNHGIRGKSATADQLFVEKMARNFGFMYELKKVKLSGSGLEEKGRVVRRAFFEALAKKYQASAVLTAHTQNDQLETILFNLVRGSFVSGMAGMREREGLYLKPFLSLPKKEILSYLKKNRLQFCIDIMNQDTKYTRVFLRKKIIPLLEKMNPSVAKTVSQNALLFQHLEDKLGEGEIG